MAYKKNNTLFISISVAPRDPSSRLWKHNPKTREWNEPEPSTIKYKRTRRGNKKHASSSKKTVRRTVRGIR